MVYFFLLMILAGNSWGTVWPLRSNTELFYLKDPAIDFAIRLEMIAQAKHSIDLISFSQAMDKTGEIFISALRQAQEKKCVKVRYIYDSVASLLDRDFFNTSGKILSYPKLNCPPDKKGEVITIGIFDKLKAGLAWDDFIHEKVLLIDAGTIDEKLVIGGRGYTEFSRRVADSAFLFRPIIPKLASFGTDVLSSFNELWDLAKTFSSVIHHSSEITILKHNSSLDYFLENQTHRALFAELKTVLLSPPKKATKLKYQFRPLSVQLASNDLFQKILKNKNTNREQLTNDNLDLLVTDLKSAQGETSLVSYSIAFPDILFRAIIDFINRGNTLNLFTNGKAAHEFFVYQGTPVYYSLEFLEKLINATKHLKGKLNIYFLNPEKAHAMNELPFVHRKLVTLDHSVFTGTDNFTWSSSKKNDEWMIRIVDKKLIQHLKEEELTQKKFYDLIPAQQIIKENQEATLLYKLFRTFIKNNY